MVHWSGRAFGVSLRKACGDELGPLSTPLAEASAHGKRTVGSIFTTTLTYHPTMANNSESLLQTPRRPTLPAGLGSAPGKIMNGHFASVKDGEAITKYSRGIQVIDEDKNFNTNLNQYLNVEKIIPSGFNYHLISVFGSQSTGKSTLLNALFKTDFGVMSESERRQTTKGIWMSKNKRPTSKEGGMAENVLVMDVEGTDGRERGEDQDFERKAALFALATSEVLIVNIWEHQVGLYQGANMGLLKTVFEVNLQLFVKDSRYSSKLKSQRSHLLTDIDQYHDRCCSLSFATTSGTHRLKTYEIL